MSIYRARFINCYKKIAYYIDSNNKIYNANNQKNIYIYIYLYISIQFANQRSIFNDKLKGKYVTVISIDIYDIQRINI